MEKKVRILLDSRVLIGPPMIVELFICVSLWFVCKSIHINKLSESVPMDLKLLKRLKKRNRILFFLIYRCQN